MKTKLIKTIRYFLLLFSYAIICYEASGQQNLFNIPSGDITPRRKVFYQHQFNVYVKKFESKGHFVYGLGRGWDAGVNIVGKGAYFTPEWRALYNDDPSSGAVFPVLLGTLQKQWQLAEHTFVNIGTQSGFNLSNRLKNKEFNHFTYGLVNHSFGHGRKILAGPYATNRMFVGTGNTVGVMVGYEWHLAGKWYLMGDWISGRNDSSVGVFGAMFVPTKRLQFCAGWMVPNPNTPKPQALVLEINILGWDYE